MRQQSTERPEDLAFLLDLYKHASVSGLTDTMSSARPRQHEIQLYPFVEKGDYRHLAVFGKWVTSLRGVAICVRSICSDGQLHLRADGTMRHGRDVTVVVIPDDNEAALLRANMVVEVGAEIATDLLLRLVDSDVAELAVAR